MTVVDRARIRLLAEAGQHAELDALMRELHRRYHDRALDHVRVHLAWMRVHVDRGAVGWAIGHVAAGLFVAPLASLAHRYLGLAVPAFDHRRTNAAS
ncbi:MAG TPA: hypothetical protein VFQ53_18705 [Kofleriaceae bacterium]|nr:hypothetical protein [Kofleriaceae bacterium]